MTLLPTLEREPAWFGDADSAIFGWYHAGAAPGLDCVAVLCGPVGYEYTRAHRTVRHLADRLAARGIPALRFDYHGIGDSAGTDLDPERLATWRANIRAAIGRAQALSGRRRVCLIGIRLGATLAALVANEIPVDLLVLWNPCVAGKPYLRELQAIAASAARSASGPDGTLESAGFVMSAQTIEEIRAIDLRTLPFQGVGRVLVVGRDDFAPDPSLNEHLAARGIANDYVAAPGWGGMMAEHQFTVVPDAALALIADWTEEWGQTLFFDRQTTAADPMNAPIMGSDPIISVGLGVEERLCRFGPEKNLFGILSRTDEARDKPAVLIFNAGAVHHVGPNRVYVTLARSLAAMGFACLRFDLEGIGDSVLRAPGRENHPYPQTATDDARAAIDFLKERYGYTRFVALGLCSGAHTAFHTGLTVQHDEIGEVILINPLTFYWSEGMSLETVSRFEDLQAYKKSMRDPGRWLKLLRGNVNLRRLLEVALQHPRTLARSYYDALRETLLPGRGPRLSRDLRRLFAMKRQVTFVIAEGDPGRDILMAGAKLTASRGIKSGQIRMETIPGGDHTFSQSKPRQEMIARVGAYLASR